MRPLASPSLTRLAALCILSLGVSMCGGSGKKRTPTLPADDGGAAGDDSVAGNGGSSGSTSGGKGGQGGKGGSPGAGTGGESDGGEAGEGTAGSSGGSGGSAGTSGTSGSGGTAGASQAGSGGQGGGCVPNQTCGPEQASCDTGWDADCGSGFTECCDPVNGIYKTCDYAGGGTETIESVFINSCTDQSFGTESCAGCLNAADPDCDSDWRPNGCTVKVFCSDFMIGYRQSCEDLDEYSSITRVECVCDPDGA